MEPVIRDLESSESYRVSGVDARRRFEREEKVPALLRLVMLYMYVLGRRLENCVLDPAATLLRPQQRPSFLQHK